MSFPGPFDLNIFWSSDRSCWGYGEKLFTPEATVRIDRVWSFSELDNYVHRLLESENQQILPLQYVLVCTDEYGRRGQAPIRDDESMSWIYRGAHLRPALYVEVADEPVQDVGEGTTGGQYDGAGSSGVGADSWNHNAFLQLHDLTQQAMTVSKTSVWADSENPSQDFVPADPTQEYIPPRPPRTDRGGFQLGSGRMRKPVATQNTGGQSSTPHD
ncbi:OLC1v1013372C1 [Oldenlandia corymbosa var. corymbosa]|uniref:OLC1v1013372C1 n=1 Tax=Oldenlandia corymbosa var. corymbosa TaxID=529605 RepID=A0AAV1DYJ4_OLDCO|nr:OLC1v1013372C1 [Oldenlandia corymbosa var. corymbosa]